MVSTIEYALMAGRAYQTTRSLINQFPVVLGWLEIAHVPNNPNFPQFAGADGFESVAFKRGTEIVISFAGTNPNDSILPPGPDNTANILLGLGFSSEQLVQAAKYYLQIQAANPNATITFTGHSLGGGLAALMGVFFGKQAVTFDQAPFAQSATPSLLPTVAERLLSRLLTDGYSVTALAGLTDFLQRRAVSGGIPNSDLVTSINVQGELLSSGVPWNITDRIGLSTYIPTNAPGVSGRDLHSQSLLTAFLQSMQTAPSQRALNDVTFKLIDLMGMIFASSLFAHPTTGADNENFLERLVRHEAGVRDPITAVTTTAADAMVTRFTSDLWKLVQEGGLTMADGPSPATNFVSKALIAFAMQMYYADTANATNANKELFTDLADDGSGSGGIRFDRADVADSLEQAKGYALYFHEYLHSDAFTDTERGLIEALLPALREWYVQAGPNGMTATDTFNHGAFLLGGSGADTLTGGSGADLLVGNAGNDTLDGGAGNDTLLGGTEFDTYVYRTGEGLDTILDRDGQGRILYDGALLTGGDVYGDQRVHRDDAGYLYVDVGLGLSVPGTLLVEGYQADDLGLSLSSTPVIPPVPTLSLYGDLAPLDADLVTSGVQWQYDSLGNIIVNPNSQEPDRADRLNGSGGNDLLAGRGGGDILAGWAGDDVLYADRPLSVADAIARGNTQFGSGLKGDWLAGGEGDDTLVGSAGNDVLMGGGERDLLIGGAGDDELLGDRDWVATSFDWTVTDLGNWTHWYEPINEFSAVAAADVIYAGEGNDYAAGGGGDDVLFGEGGDDTLGGHEGNDLLLGGRGNDAVFGGAHLDLLVGGHGDDRLDGGPGDDRYLFQRGDGTDSVIDNLAEHNVFQFGTGISADDIILRVGSLLLDMRQGDAVHMQGFNQRDVFNSSIIERFEFADGAVLTLAGLLARGFDLDGTALADTLNGTNTTDRIRGFAGGDALWGHEGDDRLDGGDGDDRLDGGTGADHLIGSVGHDTYVVDNAGDTIMEQLNEGTDWVHASISYTLGANIEYLTLTGTGTLNGTGNDLNNEIGGNEADNTLLGYSGNDLLQGGAGNDRLAGGWGNDRLIGGTGQDTYYAAAGDGTDTIVDNAGEGNRLVFGTGITMDDVTLQISGGTLMLHTGGADDQVQIANFNPLTMTGQKPVDSFEFTDGTLLTYAELARRGFTIGGPSGGGTVSGSGFNDTVIGSPWIDMISGGGGDDRLEGRGGNDALWGDTGHDRLFGGAGNDYLQGGGSNHDGGDYFEGGAGDDSILGYYGGNTYVFRRGDGQDTIRNNDPNHGAADTLIFADLLPTDLTIRQSFFGNTATSHLELVVNGTADTVTLGNWVEWRDSDLPYNPHFELELIQFTDGTVWTTADLIAQTQGVTRVGSDADESVRGSVFNDVLQGAGGNDFLDGGKGNDALDGGPGNDYLGGGYGSDTYVFGRGYGSDWIDERLYQSDYWGMPSPQDIDQVVLTADVAPGDVQFSIDSPDTLTLRIVDTGDSVTFENSFLGSYEIEQFVFADGTVWDEAMVQAMMPGTDMVGDGSGGDYFFGTPLGETLTGLAGDDILVGGGGPDRLNGGEGYDTYLFYRDGGNVTVADISTPEALNGLSFLHEVTAADVLLSHGTDTLTLAIDGTSSQITLLGFDVTGVQGTPVVGELWFEDGLSLSTVEFVAGQLTDGDDVALGTLADDVLVGRAGNDVLGGGTGNDILIGGAGFDTYWFNLGDGIDTISDRLNEFNRVVFGPGITPGMIETAFELGGHSECDTLLLKIGSGGDVVRVTQFEAVNPYGPRIIEQFEFADGTVISYSQLIDQGVLIRGTDANDSLDAYGAAPSYQKSMPFRLIGEGGNDSLYGWQGHDILVGGAGSDVLDGRMGQDTYLFNLGDGQDSIQDGSAYTNPNETNRIVFGSGIEVNDVTFSRNGEALVMGVGRSGDSITVPNFQWAHDVQTLEFADGQMLDLSNLFALPLGTAMSETIIGTSGNDTIFGGGGSDVLYGGGGNDTLVAGEGGTSTLSGGPGNDTMVGGSGIYVLHLGDGQDTIIVTNDTSANSAGNVVQFAGGYNNYTPQLALGSLVIRYGTMGDEIHIANFDFNHVFAPPAIQRFEFTDRTLTYAELIALGFDIEGTSGADVLSGTNTTDRMTGQAGNDVLDGGAGDDTLTGGLGNDMVRGGAGDDAYVFHLGDGYDRIEDAAVIGAGNRIQFGAGIASSDLRYTEDRIARTLTIQVDGSAVDQLHLMQFDPTGTNGSLVVETLVFADGSRLNLAELYPPNQAPIVATPIADQTLPEDAPFSIAIPADAFADADAGDRLTYRATLAEGTALPTWLTFDTHSRTFSGTPDDAQVGSVALTVTATDTGGLSISDTFTLTVHNVNDAPIVATPFGDQYGAEDEPFLFTVPAGTFADEDAMHGDTVTYRTSLADGSPLPTWVTFDPNTRTFSGTPGAGAKGTLQLAVTATDADMLTATDLFALIISGPLPKIFIGTEGNDVLMGARGDDTLRGLGGNDTLSGREGQDWLDGGTGNDRLIGGTGDDTYVVETTGDVVTELPNEGLDTVRTALSVYRLGANIENLTLTGGGTSIGVGNALGNSLIGDMGSNVLSGGAGDDRLIGSAGTDVLVGGTGNDRYQFDRGDGRDVMRDKDRTAGNQDRLAFGGTINPLDLVLERQANDLRLRVYGSGDQVLIDRWYSAGAMNHIETIQAGNGELLLSTQVNQLIQAMASFSQQSGLTWDQAIDQRPQDVQAVLAASWQ